MKTERATQIRTTVNDISKDKFMSYDSEWSNAFEALFGVRELCDELSTPLKVGVDGPVSGCTKPVTPNRTDSESFRFKAIDGESDLTGDKVKLPFGVFADSPEVGVVDLKG